MVDSRAKGARVETQAKEMLVKLTKLPWERTPGSGALDAKHNLKGDLYVPNHNNVYCVEVKGYAEDHINSGILTHKTPQTLEWWRQATKQSKLVSKEPLLIFKYDRSKLFVAFESMPETIAYRHMFVHYENTVEFYVALLEDWIKHEQPKFIY
jgi:hypothetical protein